MRGPKEGLLSQFLALGPVGEVSDSSKVGGEKQRVQAAALLWRVVFRLSLGAS